jgi:phosphate transport system permease protein
MQQEEVEPLKDQEQELADELQHTIKYALLDAEYRLKKLRRQNKADTPRAEEIKKTVAEYRRQEEDLKSRSDKVTEKRMAREEKVRANQAVFRTATGREKTIALVDIARPYCPNRMGFGQKVGHYLAKVWELLSTNPREANQDGGLYPAIFGTVLMVFLMAITCFPLGVLAGIYLGEYAKEGPLVKIVRVAVNNLAGIPSIVYGIFGLGFFIYICGGALDQVFFPARIDDGSPVFGQGCILWASLTLGLLTIQVVIVSTEEALRTIPRGIRESSYALGATKFQTLYRVLVPMASPGMMTGFILAMARAAGEVAPLMITGAVKIAPVPLNGTPPFLHLNRQFMHLGFHIFDISCKSPNVEATKPMVYVTTLLLLFIVLTMSSLAIWLRNNMQRRYQSRGI